MAKVLSLPGSQSVDDARLLLTADLFIMTDEVATEKVINGVVTNAVTSWISDRDHLRQVELLPWIAKELSGWDYFAPQPRGTTEPKQARPTFLAKPLLTAHANSVHKLALRGATGSSHQGARVFCDAIEKLQCTLLCSEASRAC